MRRSDFLMKLMSAVLFVAIAAYLGVYIYHGVKNPLVTAAAVRYMAQESAAAEGYTVRTETVLPGGGAVTLAAAEGERVSAGQIVATLYVGERALERAGEIRSLELRIKEARDEASLTPELRAYAADDGVLALSSAVQHMDLDGLDTVAYSVKKHVFGGASVSEEELDALQGRLEELRADQTGKQTFHSPASGLFSAVVDGFEAVGPDRLEGLVPSSLETLFTGRRGQPEQSLGKLITGIRWYYAAVMDAGDAARLAEETTATVKFTKTYNARLTMDIESIGAEEDGRCVVVFSAKNRMADITALRRLTAQVEFGAVSGLIVPKEAVHFERDRRGYVYRLSVMQAEKVYVQILGETDDGYILMDGAENGTILREGSEVITKARGLYDGKVVVQ